MGRFFQQVNGKSIADLVIIDQNGKNLTILTDSSANYGFPSWSPDGKKVVLRATGDNKNGLYILDVESKVITPLLTKYKTVICLLGHLQVSG